MKKKKKNSRRGSHVVSQCGGQVKNLAVIRLKVDTGKLTSVSPSSQQSEGLWVVCMFIWLSRDLGMGGKKATENAST